MKGQWKEWEPGDPVTVNRIVWDQAEIDQVQEVLDSDWFGPGPKVNELARLFSEFVGVSYCQLVNSGSSALTLAVDAMIELGYWKKGDLILHPLLTFPTSITPVIRAGLTPAFVDVNPFTYQIDTGDILDRVLYDHFNPIRGAIIPHLLGNICDMGALVNALDGYDCLLIEDCCDTLGGYYNGQHVGTFGKVAAFSFYGSHHMTTGGVGGALVTDDEGIYDIAKSMTHWGRNDYDKLPPGYAQFEKRYWYDTLGYDFQITELQAAFGIAQLSRVEEANKLRAKRWEQLDQYFREIRNNEFFHLPEKANDKSNPSWFAYPLMVQNGAPFTRKQFATHLIESKIEIRPIFTGDITKHPAFAPLLKQGRAIVAYDIGASNLIGKNGLFLPSWGMSDGAMSYMLEVLEGFLSKW